MSEELNNEQTEMEEGRLTKTEWEKIETIGKTVDDLKIRNLKATILNTLAVLIEAGGIGYLYFNGATDTLKYVLLCTLPMFVIAFIPYIKNVQEYFELKKIINMSLKFMSRKKVKKGRGREKVEHHFDSRVGAILRTMSKALFGLRIKSM